MKEKVLIKKLENISKIGSGCMCGHGEWCENCSSFSVSNRIKDKIRLLIRELKGIKEVPMDYGASITIKEEDLL